MKVLDRSEDFSIHTRAFARYTGPGIEWVKRLQGERAAFCRAVALLDG